jgi:hypothetical protein
MAFITPVTLQTIPEEVIKYTSGFTIEEEQLIKKAKTALELRDLLKEPVTLEEFKTVVVPWFRIVRTEDFILNPEKVKKVRVIKEKEIKPKKPTKAFIKAEIQRLIFKLSRGEAFSEEETIFFNLYAGTI